MRSIGRSNVGVERAGRYGGAANALGRWWGGRAGTQEQLNKGWVVRTQAGSRARSSASVSRHESSTIRSSPASSYSMIFVRSSPGQGTVPLALAMAVPLGSEGDGDTGRPHAGAAAGSFAAARKPAASSAVAGRTAAHASHTTSNTQPWSSIVSPASYHGQQVF